MADTRYWPQLLKEIAEVAGPDVALKLAGNLGGQKITVPRDVEGSVLERNFGVAIAALLVERYGGGSAYIPNMGLRLAGERRHFILTHPKISANDCAARLGISCRWVEKIRASARPDSRQIDLFDL